MKKIIYALMAFSPILAMAQTTDLGNVSRLVGNIGDLINKIIPVMFAVAIIFFFWGLIKFIMSAGDPAEAAKGKSIMIYGVIAIAVMVSIYGLVAWLQQTLGITQNTINLPVIPTR